MFIFLPFYVSFIVSLVCALVRGGSSRLGNQETGEPRWFIALFTNVWIVNVLSYENASNLILSYIVLHIFLYILYLTLKIVVYWLHALCVNTIELCTDLKCTNTIYLFTMHLSSHVPTFPHLITQRFAI